MLKKKYLLVENNINKARIQKNVNRYRLLVLFQLPKWMLKIFTGDRAKMIESVSV